MDIVPATTSKQAIQANTAPAKNKWVNYKQNKIKQKLFEVQKFLNMVQKIYLLAVFLQVCKLQALEDHTLP